MATIVHDETGVYSVGPDGTRKYANPEHAAIDGKDIFRYF